MSTKDQLEAMKAEIESHVENLRQLRKEAVIDDEPDGRLDEFAETIKFMGWITRSLERLAETSPEENWPEPDGYRREGPFTVQTSR
jgi:hypothetical protein